MINPTHAEGTQTTTTTQTQDLGELSFSDYERVRRGGAVTESVQKKSAPAEKAEHKHSPESDTVETEEVDAKDVSEAEGDDPEAKDSEKVQPKKKGGFQRRIDKLNQRATLAQQEAEYWKQQALKGTAESRHDAKPMQGADKPQADQAGKPDPDKFETHSEYVEALTDWKLEQRDKAKQAESQKAQQQTDQEKLLKSHAERVKAFAEKTEDFAEMMENLDDVPGSAAIEEAIITSENGAELLYELAKNPDEAKRIAALPPGAAARELGKIEAKLASKTSDDPKPEPKKLTQAPKPIEPVGAAGKGTVAKRLDDPNLSFADYERLRREQIRKRRA